MSNFSFAFRTMVLTTIILGVSALDALSQSAQPESAIVATVNQATITEEDVNLEIKRIRFQAKTMKQPIDESMSTEMREKVIGSLINRELLYQQSKAKGIVVDASEIDSNVDQIKQGLKGGQRFETQLAEMGISLDTFRNQVYQAVAIQKLLAMEVYPQATVSEKESRIFFDNNPQFFKKPEQVKASHILIQVKPEDSKEQKQAAREKIEDLQKKVKSGMGFAELAKNFSEGPSRVNGGDLGYFDRKKMVKPFSDAAFALNPGQVSDIVETRFGFHLIKVTDKKPETVFVYEDIKDKLIEMLRRKNIQEKTLQYIGGLRKAATVKQVSK